MMWQTRVTGVVAVGGVIGSLARWAVGLTLPNEPAQWPTATLLVNLVGSLCIGAVGPLLSLAHKPHPLARPFLATGVLGGFTTFSTLAVQTHQLPAGSAIAYVLISFTAGVAAVWLGHRGSRRLLSKHGSRKPLGPYDGHSR